MATQSPLEMGSELSTITAQIDAFKRKATESLANIDRKIAALQVEQAALQKTVCVDDAVDLVLNDIMSEGKAGAEQIRDGIKNAGHLGTHTGYDAITAFDANGAPQTNFKPKTVLNLTRGVSASALLALFPDLFRPAIENLVREELASNPDTGPGIEEIRAKNDSLVEQMNALYVQRTATALALSGVLDARLQVPKEFYEIAHRKPPMVLNDTSEATVKEFDDQGNEVKRVHGTSWAELMLARERASQEDARRELEQDKAEFGPY